MLSAAHSPLFPCPLSLTNPLPSSLALQKVRKHLSNLEDHNVLNSDGDTLLHTYIRRKDKHKKECLLSLLVYGDCDVDAENKQGVTPLHLAAEVVCVCAYNIVHMNCQKNP